MRHYLHFHLAWPIVILGGLLAFTCLISIWYINKLQTDLGHSVRHDVDNLQIAQELQIRLRQLRFHAVIHAADPTPERRKDVLEDEQAFDAALRDARAKLDDQTTTPLVDAIDAGYQNYLSQLGPDGIPAASVQSLADLLLWSDAHPVHDLLTPCRDLTEKHRERMVQTLERSESQTRWAGGLFIALGTIGALGGLISGYAIARWVSRTVARLSVRVQAVNAHLDQEVGAMTVESSQHLGEIDQQLHRVLGRVQEVCERLQQQQREILRAEQLAAVGQLAAGVAHEIRNPLTGLKMLIEAAIRPGGTVPLTQDEMRMMLDEVGRVERTVQGLLGIARNPLTDRCRCDLRDLIAQEVELIRARANRMQIQVEVVVPKEPVEAFVNRDQFLALLTNLMLNALESTPAGGRIVIHLSQHGDQAVQLSISDTGSGISPAIADRLFEPFATTKPTGTGLGLSVSQNIVHDHGGTLTAGNRPQGGACFTITLPTRGEKRDEITRRR